MVSYSIEDDRYEQLLARFGLDHLHHPDFSTMLERHNNPTIVMQQQQSLVLHHPAQVRGSRPAHASRELSKYHHEAVGQHKRAAQHQTTTEPIFPRSLLGRLQYYLHSQKCWERCNNRQQLRRTPQRRLSTKPHGCWTLRCPTACWDFRRAQSR
jgi:hypothetical protein